MTPAPSPGPNPPTVGAPAISPSVVSQGTTVSLTLGGISEPGGTVTAAYFYRDSNNNGQWDAGDVALAGGFSVVGGQAVHAFDTTIFVPGTYRFFARVLDSLGRWSTASAAATLTIVRSSTPPTLAAIPNLTVPAGGSLLLALHGSDSDGGPLTYSAQLAAPVPAGSVSLQTSGNMLTIWPAAAFTGVLHIQATVSEAGATATQAFTVTVVAPAAATISHSQSVCACRAFDATFVLAADWAPPFLAISSRGCHASAASSSQGVDWLLLRETAPVVQSGHPPARDAEAADAVLRGLFDP